MTRNVVALAKQYAKRKHRIIQQFPVVPAATVALFGSRVNDLDRGGDIDLMITTDTATATARRWKVRFLVRLKQRIGDRRIDVVLRTPDSRERDIHRVASSEGVPIV